jgi:hypothetical protein
MDRENKPNTIDFGLFSAGLFIKFVRLLLMLIPLAAGCAQRYIHVVGPCPDAPIVKRCLVYWTSNLSTNATNHYYVGTVRPNGGVDDLVYWKEG